MHDLQSGALAGGCGRTYKIAVAVAVALYAVECLIYGEDAVAAHGVSAP